jgi:Anti-sigma-K factor rskA
VGIVTEPKHTGPMRECGGNVAGYALGALEPAEAEVFSDHVEACVVCRDELASFQQVVDLLPMSVTRRRAPKGLRRGVLGGIKPASRPSDHSGRPWPRRLTVGPLAPALGAAVLAISIAIGGLALSRSASPTTRIYRAHVVGSTGSAQVRMTAGQTELVVRRFRPPPADHIYEVWLVRGGHAPQPTSALFSVTSNGDGEVDVPGNLRGVDKVLVTPEPVGGSTVPTHAAVITAELLATRSN